MIELRSCVIYNFKSLNNFRLNFSKFTCLIGLNGAGKSTILQSIDFISRQMKGDITGWLQERNWEAKELKCKFVNSRNINIAISFIYHNRFYTWGFAFNPSLKKCIVEAIFYYPNLNMNNINVDEKETIFEVKNSKYMIKNDKKIKKGDIIQDYEGSFLASLKPEFLPEVIREFKSYILNIYSLDLLAPQELKKRSRVGNTLGLSGKNLSAFLNTFTKEQKEEMLNQLKKAYPNLEDLNIRKSKGGWARLELIERFGDKKLTNEAKYLNDGILRLIAILAQLQSQKSFLLFDEIENGINSELIEYLMDILISSKHQVMVTTHSPMILNYIDDEVAKKSVQYIYKTKEGFTRSIPFFEIPSMAEKLEIMGAGSAYVDTNLEELVDEIEEIQKNRKEK
ncbi:MAG: AAA family ATPase [Epsilonproteobacteria bacterium]|nr:AAA family ATPase [Campylobacterota bacterium]